MSETPRPRGRGERAHGGARSNVQVLVLHTVLHANAFNPDDRHSVSTGRASRGHVFSQVAEKGANPPNVFGLRNCQLFGRHRGPLHIFWGARLHASEKCIPKVPRNRRARRQRCISACKVEVGPACALPLPRLADPGCGRSPPDVPTPRRSAPHLELGLRLADADAHAPPMYIDTGVTNRAEFTQQRKPLCSYRNPSSNYQVYSSNYQEDMLGLFQTRRAGGGPRGTRST